MICRTQTGRNRHGESFLDALCKTAKFTKNEILLIFALWAETCVPGTWPYAWRAHCSSHQ